MKVIVDKTKIVVFSKGRLPRNRIFNYNGTNIEIVKDFNYFGNLFFSDCKNYVKKYVKIIFLKKLLNLCMK